MNKSVIEKGKILNQLNNNEFEKKKTKSQVNMVKYVESDVDLLNKVNIFDLDKEIMKKEFDDLIENLD